MKKFITLAALVLFCTGGFCGDKFYDAIKSGNLKAIEEIVAAKPEAVNIELEMRSFPLNEAAILGQADVCKLLLEKGAKKTNVSQKTGNTALHDLAENSSRMTQAKLDLWKKCVEVFKQFAFDFNAKNKVGETPLLFACYVTPDKNTLPFSQEFVKCLVENGAKFEKNDGIITWIIEHPLVPGTGEKDNPADYSPLDLAKTLIELGADVNSCEKELKKTPLIYLLDSAKILDEKKQELATVLLEYGADPKAKSKDGKKPMQMVEKKTPMYDILKNTKPIKKSPKGGKPAK